MAKNIKYIPVTEDKFIHEQIGSDRYCYKVFEMSKDGKHIGVHPVERRGKNAWLNEGILFTDESRTYHFDWKYNAWRLGGNVISRFKNFSNHGSPFMDPSF